MARMIPDVDSAKLEHTSEEPVYRALRDQLFLRKLASPEPIKEKLIKIGAKAVTRGRYVAFQMAEVAVPRTLFAEILRLIAELRPPPATAPGMSIGSNDRWQPKGRRASMIDRERPNAAQRWG